MASLIESADVDTSDGICAERFIIDDFFGTSLNVFMSILISSFEFCGVVIKTSLSLSANSHPKGDKGDKGDDGAPGPAGSTGPQGEPGPAGEKGAFHP